MDLPTFLLGALRWRSRRNLCGGATAVFDGVRLVEHHAVPRHLARHRRVRVWVGSGRVRVRVQGSDSSVNLVKSKIESGLGLNLG